MNKFFLAGLISAAAISSCSDKKPDHDNSLVTSEPQAQQLLKDSSTVITPGQNTVTLPNTAGTANPAAQAAQVVSSSASAGTTAPGMNPPHGQPGHRCEIAVGAPLNSAPAAKSAASTVTTSSPAISSTPAATTLPAAVTQPTVTAPGMNPPHGQPGHDCTIAVGAPLKKN